MKSAEQIKGAVKNIAKRMNVKPQEVLQIFMFERLVERLSLSEYRENFILIKGWITNCIHDWNFGKNNHGYGYNNSRTSNDRTEDGENCERNPCY